MSSNLAGQVIVVIGGSSGIGYGVAKAALLQKAARVVIGSSNKAKVENAVERLRADVASASVVGAISGDVVDGNDASSIKTFLSNIGEIDHLVWTSGDKLKFEEDGTVAGNNLFNVRFWGAAIAAKAAKFRKGGSVTLTTGTAFLRPRPGWSLGSAVSGAVDGFTRGLAVDIAPIRVNSVCSGAVKTELWDAYPPNELEKMFDSLTKKLPVKHIAEPDEIAEAYIFCMKCKYITGQRIELDGGEKYV